MSDRLSLVLMASLLAVLACRELPTATDTPHPSLKPGGPSGPSYSVLTPPVAPGWTVFLPSAINTDHETVGVMNPEGATSQMKNRAAFWAAGGTAMPQVLPVPSGMTWSQAGAISDNGIIGGRIFPAAVLWKPTGAGWEIVPRADWGVVSGVREDGTAVGAMWDPALYGNSPPQPVVWDANGVPDTLPVPPGGPWNAGTGRTLNAQGDVAGTLEIWTPGMSIIYGALWVREGDGWTPVVMQTGPARGLSDRTTGGQVYVTASGLYDAYRHRFTRNASGQWTSDSVYVEGSANGMNLTGDFVGALLKGRYGSSPKPYLFPVGGSVMTIPLPKNATGAASGISNDGWITGQIDGIGVVWKPGS